MKNLLTLFALALFFVMSFSQCGSSLQSQKREADSLDSLQHISDSLTKSLKGFAYLQLGDTYKNVANAARKHHAQYLHLFKHPYKYMPEYGEYGYYANGRYKTVYKENILLKKPSPCSAISRNYQLKDYPKITEVNASMMLSNDITIDFNLLFFRDSLVKIEFLEGEKFVKDLICNKYGIGKIASNVDIPGVKTNIAISWSNDTVSADYSQWAEWNPPHEKLKTAGSFFTMTHKKLLARMQEDCQKHKAAAEAKKQAEKDAIINTI